MNEVELILKWLRQMADDWQTKEGPHSEPVDSCNCCFQCNEALTYRIIADAIEKGDYKETTDGR